MLVVTKQADVQIQNLIDRYGTYKTVGEVGRSAFWIWIDKIKEEIKSISVKASTKVSETTYKYKTKYWGDIFFVLLSIRNKGKFAGNILLITEFNFNEVNFYNWLQHQPLVKTVTPKPNTINPQFKPRQIGFGYTMVKSYNGLFTIADTQGKPLGNNEWFKAITKMRKTANGEIYTFVNKDGYAYVYYPQREQHFVTTNRTWSQVIAEAKQPHKPIIVTESDIKWMVTETIRKLLYN